MVGIMVLKQKTIGKMHEWARVAGELQGEDLKQKIYDNKLLDACSELKGKRILDYGAGPGIIAGRALQAGADINVYDISPEMLRIAAERIGAERAYDTLDRIPTSSFDIVTCNLVLCIVPDDEVVLIIRNIKNLLAATGTAYVGFCNPRIFDVPESLIDFRHSSGQGYEDNHKYMKKKKEGGYQIEETHRPMGWYSGVFHAVGVQISDIIFTPEYEAVSGRIISDFVIFKLKKEGQA